MRRQKQMVAVHQSGEINPYRSQCQTTEPDLYRPGFAAWPGADARFVFHLTPARRAEPRRGVRLGFTRAN